MDIIVTILIVDKKLLIKLYEYIKWVNDLVMHIQMLLDIACESEGIFFLKYFR